MKKNIREVDWERVRTELADTLEAAREEGIILVHYNSDTGEAWKVSPDGTIEPHEIGPSLTDWERVNAFTEEEIERMAEEDDSLPADWLDHAVVVRGHRRGVANGA
jgi:hypothetical protein